MTWMFQFESDAPFRVLFYDGREPHVHEARLSYLWFEGSAEDALAIESAVQVSVEGVRIQRRGYADL